MNAQELREALEHYDLWFAENGELAQTIYGAARERLAQLEGDEGLVERIALILLGWRWADSTEGIAREILAALIATDSEETA